MWFKIILEFPGDTLDKNPPASTGDTGSIPGPGKLHMVHSNKAREQLLSPCSVVHESQQVTESSYQNYWACVPQPLKPVHLGPMLCNKRSHYNEKLAHHNEECIIIMYN